MEREDQIYESIQEVEPIYLSLYNTLRDHENVELDESDSNKDKPPRITPRPPPSAFARSLPDQEEHTGQVEMSNSTCAYIEMKERKSQVGRPLPELPTIVNNDYEMPQDVTRRKMIRVDSTSTSKCKILKWCVSGCVIAGVLAAIIVPAVLLNAKAQNTGM